MRWSLSGLPVVAAARFDTWKSRVAGATVPFRTAVMRMTVCPTVPLAGDEVADRVTPSTLPVAGRLGLPVVVVVAPAAVVVVVASELELEHPATDRKNQRHEGGTNGDLPGTAHRVMVVPPRPLPVALRKGRETGVDRAVGQAGGQVTAR